MSTWKHVKDKVNLLDYILATTGSRSNQVGQNTYRVNPCPICEHKDHFTVFTDNNIYASFNGCCRGGSILDYLREVEGMTEREAYEKSLELAGETPKSDKKIYKLKEDFSEEAVDFTSLIEKAHRNVFSTNYYHGRGLSKETIEKYKLGYLPNGSEKHGENYIYVLPVSSSFVIFRTKDNDPGKRYRVEGKADILNAHYLKLDPNETTKYIFITEGYFDALSIEELGYNAIALNISRNKTKLLELVEAYKDNLKEKVFVISLDNDESGNEATLFLKEKFKAIGINSVIFEFSYKYNDINEYLQNDREGLQREIQTIPFKGTNFHYYKNKFWEDLDNHKNEERVSTGISGLDEILGGGLYSGLYVLGGASNLGKTSLALQLADSIANQFEDVLFFSLEISKFEMICRSIAREIFKSNQEEFKDITALEVMKGKTDKEMIKNFLEEKDGLSKSLAIIQGNYNIGVRTIRERIAEHIAITGNKATVFIDCLQALSSVDGNYSDRNDIDNNLIELKRMSRDFDIPIIVTFPFKQQDYHNIVDFGAFKESEAIEYTADVILGLQASVCECEKAELSRPVELVVMKNRQGPSCEEVKLEYYTRQNYFKE